MGNSATSANVTACRLSLCRTSEPTSDVITSTVLADTAHPSPENTEAVPPDDGAETLALYAQIEEVLLTRVVIGICVFGVLGNLLTLGLLLTRQLRYKGQRSAGDQRRVARTDLLGLIALTTSDLLLCVSILPHAGTDFSQQAHRSLSFRIYFEAYENAAINTFITASTWLTVAMTINRYFHLCHPMLGLRHCGSRFVTSSIILSVLFSVVFNVPRFWMWEIDHCDCMPSYNPRILLYERLYGLANGPLKRAETLEVAYQWSYFFLGIIIPLLILAYCNCRIIRAVYNSVAVERNRNQARALITRTLICIVILYLFLVSPSEMIKFFQTYVIQNGLSAHNVAAYNLAVTVSNTLQAINFAANFIPYLVLDKTFRRLLESICSKVWCHGDRKGKRRGPKGGREGEERYGNGTGRQYCSSTSRFSGRSSFAGGKYDSYTETTVVHAESLKMIPARQNVKKKRDCTTYMPDSRGRSPEIPVRARSWDNSVML